MFSLCAEMATDANNLGSDAFYFEGNVRNPTIIEAGMYSDLDAALVIGPNLEAQSGGNFGDNDVYSTGRNPYDMTPVKTQKSGKKRAGTEHHKQPSKRRRKPV